VPCSHALLLLLLPALLQDVVREPYRLRILNGCNAKALIIYFR
jgi:hypothetical protein